MYLISLMESQPPQVAVLMTCRDRRASTLAALDALAAQTGLPAGTRVRVHLVDAGSRDGTAEAVRRAHPGVQVAEAGPDVYWSHGMRLASRNSRAAGLPEPTHQLWLGVGVRLRAGALAELLATARRFDDAAIVVGAVARAGVTVRSGRSGPPALALVEPTGAPERCATYDGDVVLVPWAVRERVGDIDKVFRHGMGDHDHGLRARRAGVAAYVAPRTVGEWAGGGSGRPASSEPGIGVREALRRVASEAERPVWPWAVYCVRHAGVRAPGLIVAPYVLAALRAGRTRGRGHRGASP
ncbi:glycosyltransferase family 2 protein [Streptomyces sp. NPDC059524]|uniref:glycosyltransferase family 2 protein n=1 Tax=Streptomyces sp. NPDC059524 TaxID=3346856 RepID=UPI0036BACEE6